MSYWCPAFCEIPSRFVISNLGLIMVREKEKFAYKRRYRLARIFIFGLYDSLEANSSHKAEKHLMGEKYRLVFNPSFSVVLDLSFKFST